MKNVKMIAALPASIALLALLASCSGTAQPTAKPQTSTVQLGNLVVSTTSTGNLAFTTSEDLAFSMAGTVEDVRVSVGDSVKKDQLIATLDTSAWNDQIKSLQKAVTTAQRNLVSAERQIGAQQLSVEQTQLNLQGAENNAASIPAVQNAQDLVDNAEAALKNAQVQYIVDPATYGPILASIKTQLTQAQKNLQSVLNGTSFTVTSDVTLQISKAKLAIQQAQRAVDDANIAVANAIQARDDAKQALDDAQSNLDEAKALSPEVRAAFDGFVTAVNVEGGQDVKIGAVAATVADPTRFQVTVLVGERDVASISVGGIGTVSVNSVTGTSLPATITTIAPTATIQQGVVNYQVTVQLASTANLTRGTQASSASSGNPPTRTPTSTGSPSVSTGNSTRSGFGLGQGGGLAASNSALTLRQGLSVTVNLITSAKSNVLIIPSRAIVRQQGRVFVNVERGTTTEQVTVTTGISNSSSTEITSGLSEGDVVVIPVATTTSTSSTQQRGGAIFPGGGLLR